MGLLYYYTTAQTMQYILSQGDIFATHISYLNDSEEYVNGLRELREVFREIEPKNVGTETVFKPEAYKEAVEDVPPIYSISFSKEADLLSQWYMYARESGVRLGMSFPGKEQQFLIKRKNSGEVGETQPVSAVLRDVHYFTRTGMPFGEYQEEKQKIKEMVGSYAEEIGITTKKGGLDFGANGVRLWKEIAPFIKNYEFRQEKEARFIFNASASGKDSPDAYLIEYRCSNGALIPYIDVYMEKGWPVTEIMVGPGRNQTRVFKSICHYVENNKLKIPEIDQKESMRRFMEGMSSYQVEPGKIEENCRKIEDSMAGRSGFLTYRDVIYDVLKDGDGHERKYLERNYYAGCGIVVRKSNAPYEFS